MNEEINTPSNETYSADSIQVLEGLEAVRKRPAMYIGDTGIKGLHHLVYEIVDNSIDEALAGYCTHIEVTINEDNSITVEDNGRGIPVDMHHKDKKSALEVAMTILHAGGKFNKGTSKVSGGLHGVGMSCVNALSTHMITQVFRNGKIYQQEYEKGKPLYAVKEVGTCDHTGTHQQFWPDGSIFTETVYRYDILADRMRELAYLNAGIKITLTDKRVLNEDGSVKQEVFFQIRESDPKHAANELRQVADYMKRNPEAKIRITGYADKNTGNARVNMEYSQKRADEFKAELVKSYGADAARILTEAKGDTVQPFSDNDRNRCVIIVGPVK